MEELLSQAREVLERAKEFLRIIGGEVRGDVKSASRKYQMMQPKVVVAEEILRCYQELQELEEMECLGMPEVRVEREKVEGEFERAAKKLHDLNTVSPTHNQHLVTMEIKPGTGGDEAALFASDLFTMYCNYANFKGWKYTVSRLQLSTKEGIKEVIINFHTHAATPILQSEAGVHRVQRVPRTESMNRIHTSTAIIWILPQIPNPQIQIDKKDLEIQRCRSSGPGGQSVNTSDSAITILHIPTGIRVSQQDERSQRQNQEKALAILKQRLLIREQKAQLEKLNSQRTSQAVNGARVDKIRTYHFPQNRVTDHRCQVSSYVLKEILQGQERFDEFLGRVREKL